MNTALAVAALLAVAAIAWRLLGSGLERAIAAASDGQDPAPLLAAIARRAPAAQPDAYNHAIRRLWDTYQRPLAVPLIRTLVEQHPDARIAQYWLDQLRHVEPALAREQLGDGFYDAHFQPHVAATCGKAGCSC